MEKNATMTANNNRIIEMEIAKGEQDNVFEDYPQSERKRMQNKLCSKVSMTKVAKHNVPRVSVRTVSARIAELARPTKQRVLNTLHEKATILPPEFVDNLVKIIEAEACLTPEETMWIRRRKKRRTKKVMQLPLSFGKKRMREITGDTTRVTTLNRDATMCQYLMAERFVRDILECQREKQEDVREIADVIMKRLMSLDEYADVKNGDRATQQLRLLADVIARWIIEICDEVTETHKEVLKQYDKKRQMRRLEVNDDNKINDKPEKLEQMDQMKEKEMQEEKSFEVTNRNDLTKEKSKLEQKGDEMSDKENDEAKEKAREREQLDDIEAKDESVKDETIEEQKNVEINKEQEEKSKEGPEMEEEKESEEKEEKETTEE